MNAISTTTAAALLAAAASVAAAQAQSPPTSTDPSAASSPHQRDATGAGTDEAAVTNGADPSAASSPHQHQAIGQGHAENGNADTSAATRAGADPATFVTTATQDGMTEVAVAKLALQKSGNEEVKQFAQKMVHDHEQADEQLAQIAKTKGLAIPVKLDAKHEAMVKAMRAKSGASFDASYAAHMAKAHSNAVALFESASKSSDADIAAFAQKTLPTLEVHKQMADNLRASTQTREASAAHAAAAPR